jgi:hypothetical protein
MANFVIGAKADRLQTYAGMLQINVGVDNYQYKFLKEMTVTYDDTDLDRDRVDDGKPVFTRVGDVLGSFAFRLGASVDLAQSIDPPTDEETASYWIDKLATNDPAELNFVQTFQAPESVGNKFARLRFTGRIMKVEPLREEEVGVNDFNIEGEIIAHTEFIREAS